MLPERTDHPTKARLQPLDVDGDNLVSSIGRVLC